MREILVGSSRMRKEEWIKNTPETCLKRIRRKLKRMSYGGSHDMRLRQRKGNISRKCWAQNKQLVKEDTKLVEGFSTSCTQGYLLTDMQHKFFCLCISRLCVNVTSATMECATDPLVLVPKEEWWSLKDKFKENWPYGLTAYSALLTQCVLIKKFPDYPVQIFTVFDNPDNGVVCVWSLIPKAYEISIFSMEEDTSKITEALVKTKYINWGYKLLFCCLMKEHVKCVEDALDVMGITELIYDDTYVAHLEKNIAKSYETEHPDSDLIKVLRSEMAEEIDEVWPHRFPGSVRYFKTMLKRDAGIGIVNNDLRAWCLLSARGDLHAVTTKLDHRRKGYAQLLVKTMSKRLAEENREIYGCIISDNEPSKKMFTALGFKLIFTVTWIETK